MSEESKKIEKIEPEKKEVKPAELPEQELDNVAGGIAVSDPGYPYGSTKPSKPSY